MHSSELPKRKRKLIVKPREPVASTANDKYINKIIIAESPYLERGVTITKKYLNPYYIEPEKEKNLHLPPLRQPRYASDTIEVKPFERESSPRPSEKLLLLKPKPIEGSAPHTISAFGKASSPDVNSLGATRYSSVRSKYLGGTLTKPIYTSTSKLTYYFFECTLGNNGALVRKILLGRSWWKDCNVFRSFKPTANLSWLMGMGSYNFDNLTTTDKEISEFKCVNRYQNGFEINDKDNLYRNLWHHCREDRTKVLEIVPVTFSFRVQEASFEQDLQEFARYFLALSKGVDVSEIKPLEQDVDTSGNNYDVYFRFRNKFAPGTKERSSSFTNFTSKDIKQDRCLFDGHGIWMLKPSGLNRGRGLELFTNLNELDGFLKMFSEGYDVTEFANMEYDDEDDISPALKAQMNKDKKRKQPLVYKNSDYTCRINNFVIQKYIERPLLFKGHKFDIRVFAFLSHEKELFVFNDAYVRLSSLPYDASKKNYLIHLTNNAVQVRSNSYGSIVKGNIISIREFEQDLMNVEATNPNKSADRPVITPGYLMTLIKDRIKLTFDCAARIIDGKNPRKFNFELFGYDFMLDEDLKLWLIEVNSVPSLGESNPYITRFMHRAIDDMFRLTIDKIFPAPSYLADLSPTTYDLPPFASGKNLFESVAKYGSSSQQSNLPSPENR